MSETKHTPGPWEIDRSGAYYKPCIRHNGLIVAWLPNGARALLTGAGRRKAEERADARLIAASPELLSACKNLVAAANCKYMREAMEYEGYFDKARAAISAAEGGTS